MAKFTLEEAAAVIEINQLVNDWVFELDFNHGLGIAALVTEDCSYEQISGVRLGRRAIVAAYRERAEKLLREADELPPMRHLNANLRVSFRDADFATITFGMVYYTAEGNPSGTDHTDAAAVADVYMDCRRELDGHWRISRFHSGQPFVRDFS